MLAICEPIAATTTLTQNTITVTFEDPVMYSTSILGEYFVAPCTVESVTPAWDGTTNGAMLNPDPASTQQGFDNRNTPTAMSFGYNAALRATFPLTLVDGDRLVLSRGRTDFTVTGGGATHVSDIMILTCKSTLPEANTVFRPSYCDSACTVYSDPDYDLLPGLALPSGCSMIDMSAAGAYFNKTVFNYGNKLVTHSQVVPSNHGSSTGYSDDNARRLSRMSLACLIDHPTAQSIANRIIQRGIDLYPQLSSNGVTWARIAGHGHGFKWPILFAKLMLGQSGWTLPYYVTGSSGQLKFEEDGYTYYGASSVARHGEVCDVAGYGGSYSADNHVCRAPDGDMDQWYLYWDDYPAFPHGAGGAYEYSNTSRSWVGFALAARLLESSCGAMTAWGHAPFFSYMDRWVNEIADDVADFIIPGTGNHLTGTGLSTDASIDANKYGGTGVTDNALFMKRMWETYR